MNKLYINDNRLHKGILSYNGCCFTTLCSKCAIYKLCNTDRLYFFEDINDNRSKIYCNKTYIDRIIYYK